MLFVFTRQFVRFEKKIKTALICLIKNSTGDLHPFSIQTGAQVTAVLSVYIYFLLYKSKSKSAAHISTKQNLQQWLACYYEYEVFGLKCTSNKRNTEKCSMEHLL